MNGAKDVTEHLVPSLYKTLNDLASRFLCSKAFREPFIYLYLLALLVLISLNGAEDVSPLIYLLYPSDTTK